MNYKELRKYNFECINYNPIDYKLIKSKGYNYLV